MIKLHIEAFTLSGNTITKLGQIIQSDVGGSIEEKSFGDKK